MKQNTDAYLNRHPQLTRGRIPLITVKKPGRKPMLLKTGAFLGRGAFSEVYELRHANRTSPYAVKRSVFAIDRRGKCKIPPDIRNIFAIDQAQLVGPSRSILLSTEFGEPRNIFFGNIKNNEIEIDDSNLIKWSETVQRTYFESDHPASRDEASDGEASDSEASERENFNLDDSAECEPRRLFLDGSRVESSRDRVAVSYTLMDKMDGTLRDLVDANAFDETRARGLVDIVRNMMVEAWKRGFVYADMKLENLLYRYVGEDKKTLEVCAGDIGSYALIGETCLVTYPMFDGVYDPVANMKLHVWSFFVFCYCLRTGAKIRSDVPTLDKCEQNAELGWLYDLLRKVSPARDVHHWLTSVARGFGYVRVGERASLAPSV